MRLTLSMISSVKIPSCNLIFKHTADLYIYIAIATYYIIIVLQRQMKLTVIGSRRHFMQALSIHYAVLDFDYFIRVY